MAYPLDAEHFGFTEGAIGSDGAQEFLIDVTLRDIGGAGSLANKASALELKCTALQSFRISTGGALVYYEITGIEGPPRATVQSLFFGLRNRLVAQDQAPLGLTVSAAQLRGFLDETGGLRAGHSGTKIQLLVARELRRELGAYGAGVALPEQIAPGVWPVVETRCLRDSTEPAANALWGLAPYVGPTLYARIGRSGFPFDGRPTESRAKQPPEQERSL